MFCALFHYSSFLFPNSVNIPLNLALTLDTFAVFEVCQPGDAATAETGAWEGCKRHRHSRDGHKKGVSALQEKEVCFSHLKVGTRSGLVTARFGEGMSTNQLCFQ